MTATKISVRVQAGARDNEVVGIRDGVLTVRVTAPPVEGRANESLCRLLAKRLRVPRSSVAVVRGHRSRDKVVEIDGLDEASAIARLTK